MENNENELIEKIKGHVKKHKTVYLCAATGLIGAGITWAIMRDVDLQRIGRGIAVTANRGIAVEGKSGESLKHISRATGVTAGRDIVVTKRSVLNNVSYISANRQGPPSWVIRCKETGGIWSSQRSTAMDMNLSEAHLSSHLSGMRDHVNGYHFERICMAA